MRRPTGYVACLMSSFRQKPQHRIGLIPANPQDKPEPLQSEPLPAFICLNMGFKQRNIQI